MKPKSRWPEAHINLKRLYESRAPKDMTQGQFGAKFDIGTQGMVWQYLSGHRPLNFEAAAKFAKGLNCTIYDICPEMADALKQEILPVLGRAMRRAAVIACFALLPISMWPQTVEASAFLRPSHPPTVYYVKLRRRIRRALEALAALFGTGAAAACSTIDEHTSAPPDWPRLELLEHRLPHAQMRDYCAPFVPWWGSAEACNTIDFEKMRCDIYFSSDFPPQAWIVEHEYLHCSGHDHVGDTTISDEWRNYKASVAGRALADSVR